MVKRISKKPRANVLFNEKRKGCSLSLLLLNTVWRVLASVASQEEEIKHIQIAKEVKLLLTDGPTAYLENVMQSTEQLKEPVSLAKLQDIGSIYTISSISMY